MVFKLVREQLLSYSSKHNRLISNQYTKSVEWMQKEDESWGDNI